MLKLNLPEYSFRYRESESGTEIFDVSRKKYVKLTSEEWVRQNFQMYLIKEKSYPTSLISIEKTLKYNNLPKKADIVIYDRNGSPKLIIECKAPSVKISQKVFDQAARYNYPLQANYLIVTNGLVHYCCKMDYTNKSWEFVNEIPSYNLIMES